MIIVGLIWRAIDNLTIIRLAYALIICWESITAILAWSAVISMVFKYRLGVTFAKLALIFAILLYFLGFLIIGGEWFEMWQSSVWNATHTAAYLVIIFLLILRCYSCESKP